jgi:hypothetical protein
MASKSPEKELEEFLAGLPAYMVKVLWYDTSSMSLQEKDDRRRGQRFSIRRYQPDTRLFNESELRRQFEGILQRIPAEWEKYHKIIKTERERFADRYAPRPKAKLGRKQNVALAERIWALDAEGKGNREIQAILNTGGENLSLEAVESYLKKRRRLPAK